MNSLVSINRQRQLTVVPAADWEWMTSLQILADHLATLLTTPVTIMDSQQVIRASPPARLAHHSSAPAAHDPSTPDAVVSLKLAQRPVTVQINQIPCGEVLSPSLLHQIVAQLYAQITSQPPATAQELKDGLVQHLLRNALADSEALIQRGRQIGIDLQQPAYVVLIQAAAVIFTGRPQVPADLQQRTQRVIARIVRICGPGAQIVCAAMGDGDIALLCPYPLPAAADRSPAHAPRWHTAATLAATETLLKHLQAQLDPTIRLAIGRWYPGISGLSRSYGEARTLLDIQADGSQLASLDRLGIEAFVCISDARLKRDVARRCLAPLLHDPEHLKTLIAFFAEDCCPSATAQRLSIHRNTLSYRLSRIAQLTGLDPRRFDAAVQLRLALFVCPLPEAPGATTPASAIPQ